MNFIVEHAQVYGRLVKGETTGSILPKSVEVSVKEGERKIALNDGKTFELDACHPIDTEWADVIDVKTILIDGLTSGHTIGIIGLGIGECYSPKHHLAAFTSAVSSLSSTGLSVSYRLLGITDAACMDLETFERIPADQLTFDRLPLKPCTDWNVLTDELSKGNALPVVVVIEAHDPVQNTIGRAYLADLGGWLVLESAGSLLLPSTIKQKGSLERSLSHLLSTTIDMQQSSCQVDLKYPLMSLLSEALFSGKCKLAVCLDIVVDGSVRSLTNGLTLGECLRGLRSVPSSRHCDPSPAIIGKLQEDLEAAVEERRTAQAQARHLKKQLERLEETKEVLKHRLSASESGSQLDRFLSEYQLATMELEAVALKDSIWECQMAIVRAEGQACSQGLQSAELVEINVVKQRQVEILQHRSQSREHELSTEIHFLSEQLKTSSSALDASQAESRRLTVDVRAAHLRISALNDEIEDVARARNEIQTKADAGSPVRRAQEREIGTLRKQLEQARAAEDKLNVMLAKSDARAEAHRQILADLETQLAELRKQTSGRSAKADSHTSDKMSATLEKMEAEWKQERQAMKQLLDDFKKAAINTQAVEPANGAVEGDGAENYGSLPHTKPKSKPPPPIKKTDKPATHKISKKEPYQPSSDYDDGSNSAGNSKKAPKKTHAAPIPKKPAKKSVPIASILPEPAAALSTAHASINVEPVKLVPEKLWKPSSFLPNLTKRATPVDNPVENAPLFANLAFGPDGDRAANGAAKRIKLPTKAMAIGGEGAPFGGKQSMFRSAAASANPISTDPSLLPAIIASFNVKIPPKK